MDSVIWPKIFTDEGFQYEAGENRFGHALADAHMGWGLCYAGNTPPKNFGKAMVKIGAIVGGASPERINEITDKFLKEKEGLK